MGVSIGASIYAAWVLMIRGLSILFSFWFFESRYYFERNFIKLVSKGLYLTYGIIILIVYKIYGLVGSIGMILIGLLPVVLLNHKKIVKWAKRFEKNLK